MRYRRWHPGAGWGHNTMFVPICKIGTASEGSSRAKAIATNLEGLNHWGPERVVLILGWSVDKVALQLVWLYSSAHYDRVTLSVDEPYADGSPACRPSVCWDFDMYSQILQSATTS